MKKVFAVFLSLCLLLGAAFTAAADSPEAILARCADAMRQLNSFAVKGTLTTGVQGLISPITVDALSAQVFAEPFKAHVLANVMGYILGAYAEEQGGKLYLYTTRNLDYWVAHTVDWALSDVPEPEPAMLAEWLAKAGDVRVEGTETIGGREAWRLGADINLRELMEHDTIEEGIGVALGVQAKDLLPLYEPLPLRIDVFVDVQTNVLLRVGIDASEFFSSMLTLLTPSQPGMQSEPMAAQTTLTIDFMDFDAVPDFEVPAEAKAR